MLAITGFALLEFFRRLPVIFLAKQFLIRDTATAAKKPANVLKRAALNR